MIGFLIGTLLGGAAGVATMCMCSVAADADRHLEDNSPRKAALMSPEGGQTNDRQDTFN